MTRDEIQRLDAVTACIAQMFRGQMPSELSIADWPEDEIRQVAQYVAELAHELQLAAIEIRRLSEGNLDDFIQGRLPVSHSMKNLQASLRHLTWQTTQVAKGDFSQHVDFLGQFSIAFNQMVAQLAENQQRLIDLAEIDELTKIFNRRALMKRMSSELRRAERSQHPISVAMLDVDHFKRVNDTYGHAAGDRVLVEVARRLRASVREYDVVGRYGGEEFTVVMPDISPELTAHVGERLVRCVADAPISAEGQSLDITISAGVIAVAPDGDHDAEIVTRAADALLYRAKEEGRNRAVYATFP